MIVGASIKYNQNFLEFSELKYQYSKIYSAIFLTNFYQTKNFGKVTKSKQCLLFVQLCGYQQLTNVDQLKDVKQTLLIFEDRVNYKQSSSESTACIRKPAYEKERKENKLILLVLQLRILQDQKLSNDFSGPGTWTNIYHHQENEFFPRL